MSEIKGAYYKLAAQFHPDINKAAVCLQGVNLRVPRNSFLSSRRLSSRSNLWKEMELQWDLNELNRNSPLSARTIRITRKPGRMERVVAPTTKSSSTVHKTSRAPMWSDSETPSEPCMISIPISSQSIWRCPSPLVGSIWTWWCAWSILAMEVTWLWWYWVSSVLWCWSCCKDILMSDFWGITRWDESNSGEWRITSTRS